jgi:hypothetical protein
VDSISSAWAYLTAQRRSALIGSAAVVVVGVLLIAVGEVRDWGWTRLVGAGLISAAATLFGVLLGWGDAGFGSLRATVRKSARLIVIVLAAIVVLPVTLGLLISLAGLFTSGQDNSGGVLVAGSVVTAFMLAITVGLAYEALRLAVRSASGEYRPDASRSNGKNGS